MRDLLNAANAPDALAPVLATYRPASWITVADAALADLQLQSATAEWAMKLLVELVKEDRASRALFQSVLEFDAFSVIQNRSLPTLHRR